MNMRTLVVTVMIAIGLIAVAALFWFGTPDSRSSPDRGGSQAPLVGSDDVSSPAAGNNSNGPRTAVEVESPSSPADTSFHIRCLGSDGLATSGVLMFEAGVEGDDWVGTTGEDGDAVLAGEPERDVILTTSHPRHVTETHSVHIFPGGRLALQLSLGASIFGRVVYPDGSVDFEDVRVLACPVANLPSPRAVERARNGSPSPLHLVQPDSLGNFQVHGVDAGKKYFVTAAGAGCMAHEYLNNVRPEDEPVELELWWLYGARVRFLESGDTPLRTGPEVGEVRGIGFYCQDRTLEIAAHTHLEAVLAWMSPDEVGAPRGHGYLALYLSSANLPSAGPVEIDANVPGYARSTTFLPLPHLVDHIPVHRVELTALVEEWGTLEVRFPNAPDLRGLHPGPADEPPATLKLADGSGDLYQIAIRELSTGAKQTFSVPRGQYQARFYSGSSDYTYPEAPEALVVDLLDGTAVVEIPLEETGAVHITLLESGGATFTGHAVLRVSSPGNRGYRHVRFSAPPFLLQGMAPHEYVVGAITGSNFGAPGGEAFRGTIEVRQGELADLVLTRHDQGE